MRKAFHRQRGQLFSLYLVLDERIGLVRQQDAFQVGMRLKARGKIHFAADDRIVHSILAAEIADGAIASIDTDAQMERQFETGVGPFRLQPLHPLLHCYRHPDTCERILLNTL
ncbi:hypothetical protein D9M70_447130 [compost metagenome]